MNDTAMPAVDTRTATRPAAESGVDQEGAKAKALRPDQADFATRADLAPLATKADLRAEIAGVKTEIAKAETRLGKEIAGVRSDMNGLEHRLRLCEGNAMKTRVDGLPDRGGNHPGGSVVCLVGFRISNTGAAVAMNAGRDSPCVRLLCLAAALPAIEYA